MEDCRGGLACKIALFGALATTGKALPNGRRLELLDLLTQGERTVAAPAAGSTLRDHPAPMGSQQPGRR